MKRKILIALMTTICLSSVACNNQTKNNNTTSTQSTSVEETTTEMPTIEEEKTTQEQETIENENTSIENQSTMDIDKIGQTASNINNSAKMVDALYDETKENVLYSQLSLDIALGMVKLGASEDANKLLTTYLGNNDQAKISQYYNTIEGVETANAIWVDEKSTLKNNYVDTIKKDYYGEIANVDFNDPEKAIIPINEWANNKTKGLIPKIVTTDDVNDDTKSILTNSLYFSSNWVDEWNKEENFSFTNEDNSTTKVDAIRNEVSKYYENDKAIAFGAYYKNGLMFIGILPKESGDFNVTDLDVDGLLKSDNEKYRTKYDIYATMPKIKYDTQSALTNHLKQMGLEDLFNENIPSFPNIIEENPLYISNVIQKCSIDLDENGTTATAVTAIIVDKCNALPMQKEEKEIILDRPYAYMIYDENTQQVLFMGKVTNLN